MGDNIDQTENRKMPVLKTLLILILQQNKYKYYNFFNFLALMMHIWKYTCWVYLNGVKSYIKKQNCKSFSYRSTFIVAMKFLLKINKCNWKCSWYFHKLNCFVIFPLQESAWDLSGNLIFYENVCFTIKETRRSKSFKWSEFTMIVIKYSI